MSTTGQGVNMYRYNEIDRATLYPCYPDPSEYDLSTICFRSETREFAREVYKKGFDDSRKVNQWAAETAAMILNEHYEEIYDVLSVTTTQHNERVIIINERSGSRNHYTIGDFSYEFRKNLPSSGRCSKRHFCNRFRDEMKQAVNKIIDEVHEQLAGLGVPAKPL